MTRIATVERVLDAGDAEVAEISVARETACGHDCASCGGCGAAGRMIYAKAKNPIGAEPGQRVMIQSASADLLGAAAIVYLLPPAAFLIGYLIFSALTDMTVIKYAGAVFMLFAGLVPAFLYDRRMRKRGDIVFKIIKLL